MNNDVGYCCCLRFSLTINVVLMYLLVKIWIIRSGTLFVISIPGKCESCEAYHFK